MAKKLIAAVTTVLFLCNFCLVFAEEQATITIKKADYTAAGMDFEVEVDFKDINLYNESVFLSYHILDEQGNTLRFENERFPVVLSGEKTEPLEIHVDIASLPEMADRETARIQFDLVDSKNVYWFSDEGLLNGENTTVTFERVQMQAGKPQSPKPALDIPAVILNSAAWIGVLYCFWKMRFGRKEKL